MLMDDTLWCVDPVSTCVCAWCVCVCGVLERNEKGEQKAENTTSVHVRRWPSLPMAKRNLVVSFFSQYFLFL